MSPPRRRSARLASAVVAKPQKASLLSSVVERDETPAYGPSESMDTVMTSPQMAPKTPALSSPVKLSMKEMHPSKVHPTVAHPSSAFRLGFTDINPTSKPDQPSGITQTTPSKTSALPSSPFTFRHVRPEEDMGLSNEAQQMMQELREEAAKIKADLVAQREQESQEAAVTGRKIALPKGKVGRFSAAHIAEFKKMDSIENHASSFRALPGRFTPVAGGNVTRSPSKARLEDKGTPSVKPSLKRSPSKANLDDSTSSLSSLRKQVNSASVRKPHARSSIEEEPPSPAKRAKQRLEDDASSSRPVSRDASSIPRPKSSGNDSIGIPRSHSTLASLVSPTKSSLARAMGAKGPASVFKSPLNPCAGGLKKSATVNNVRAAIKISEPKPAMLSPGRFEKVKAILRRGSKGASDKPKSALPLPFSGGSQTPAPPHLEKKLPPVPVTSPRRRLVKRMEFTPSTKSAAPVQNSPSPIRSGIPKSRTMRNLGEVHYPALDGIIAEDTPDDVTYPDLSKFDVPAPGREEINAQEPPMGPPSVPGTFSFRADHTIRFGSVSPKGFGGSPGQSSLRQVRQSFMPIASMPGSFPNQSALFSDNKENTAPAKPIFTHIQGFAHGIMNKKRHRVSADEDEAEAEETDRAAKKRRFEPAAEGDALFAPNLVGATKLPMLKTPTSTIRAVNRLNSPMKSPAKSPLRSTAKKRPVLSLSRLNALARPKNRV